MLKEDAMKEIVNLLGEIFGRLLILLIIILFAVAAGLAWCIGMIRHYIFGGEL